ncbi:MAG: flagellar biosynthesis protein FliQ [Proteobacteria bacterium]|nr:flagellar biosynthesis protein FliQ [Pseudomonadota bacterium]MDA0959024.1 flagellar biosynthesis protein FliQ [Pseudomonadota bacterium]
MTPEVVMNLGQDALMMTMMLAGPLLLAALGVGLLIGIFQAATQIQEMTLSFIPKLGALVVALLIGGPWMIRTLVEFTTRLFNDIPTLVG